MKKSPERFRFFFRSGQVRSLMILAILFVAQTYVLHAASFKEASFPQKPETAAIEGTVKNSKGAPIAGATLILEEKGASKTIEAKTNAEGAYVLKTDHAGIYTVRVGKSGWLDTVADAIQLSIGEKKHIDLVLTPDDSVKLKSSARLPSKNEPVGAMEFADEPNFTVAGITDWSNLGLHGSAASSQTSETLAKQTLALKPVNSTASESVARTRYEAATVLSSKGEYARARDEVRKLLASSNDAEGHRFLGELDEKLGDPLSAVHEYQQAARMDPSEQNYFEWGTELLLHKAAEPAAEVFTNGAHAHSKSARMLTGLGAALFASGSWEEAARRLCDASDLDPANEAPYLFLGKIEMATPGPLPCSEEKLARFAQGQPENALANYYYAVSLWKREKGSENSPGVKQAEVKQAEALLEKAVSINPKLGEAYLQLGIMHAARGDFRQATRDFEKTTEVNPNLGEAHRQLGLIYQRTGEKTKAQQEIQAYQQAEKAETAERERQQRELRQFLIVLKDQKTNAPPH